MSAYLLAFLSLCLPVNPSVFKPLCQGVRQSVFRIVCQYLWVSVFYIHPSGRLSIYVSLCYIVSLTGKAICMMRFVALNIHLYWEVDIMLLETMYTSTMWYIGIKMASVISFSVLCSTDCKGNCNIYTKMVWWCVLLLSVS